MDCFTFLYTHCNKDGELATVPDAFAWNFHQPTRLTSQIVLVTKCISAVCPKCIRIDRSEDVV